MRIERVVAHAFGPLIDTSLDLAPGMTVVHGPNEAGKSSWHAALYAGLCGVRRSRGGLTGEDREFRDLHKPWDDERWEAEVLVRLADGRQIEIRQDLAGRVACRATDIALGLDVSNEIMFEGSPDGSRWLGLDRRAFLATACIGQAELLAIARDPDLLQEHIQRAAATRGTDATAAAAIDRLEDFRRAQVGEDRANSTKPLRRARLAVESATDRLTATRERHAAYLELVAAADAARDRADRADDLARPLVAAVTARRAEAAARNAERATELAARYPAGAPSGIVARDELRDRVAAALDAWDSRPSPVSLEGESADDMERRLASLPTQPTGDLVPAEEVVRAKTTYDRGVEALRLVGERPELPVPSNDAIPLPEPGAPSDRVTGRSDRLLGGAAVVVGAVGLAMFAADLPLVGFALLAGAVGLVAVLGLARSSARRDRGRSPVATAPSPVEALEDRRAAWDRLHAERTAALAAAASALERLIVAHGTSATGGDPDVAFGQYLSDCRLRATRAGEASGATTLRAAVAARRDLERNALDVDARLARIEGDLRRVAVEASLVDKATGEAGAPAELVDELRAWQARRAAAGAADEAAMRGWQELATLLDGRSVTDLRTEADRLASRAAAAGRGLDPAVVAGVDPGPDPEGRIARLEGEAVAAHADADRLAGQLAEVERGLDSVAEAEERLAAAETELARVTDLDRVLQTTLGLLRAAETRIHRDLAPVLGAAIAAQLPRISGGRYVEAAVNPADLAVRVKAADGGRWRDAQRLSHGTREQIYLLLRLAMTEQLVTQGEVAPLICDEVTVQSDQVRAFELLDLLHETSRTRQVVVFTHDERALAWAEANLTGDDDRLVRLASAPAMA